MRLRRKNRIDTHILTAVVILIFTGALGFGGGLLMQNNMNEMHGEDHSMDSMEMIEEHRQVVMQNKEIIHTELIKEGMFACCLEKPCTYCIEKSPGHGEGAVCACLKDVMEGVHPCGECIGEILEGHGNKFLAPYFATAIAEKTGQQKAIQLIIEEKYGVPIEEQL